jgi:hypothetical protein
MSSASTPRARSRGCSEGRGEGSRVQVPSNGSIRARPAFRLACHCASWAGALIPAGIGEGRADVLAALLTAAVVGGQRLGPVRVGGAQGRHCAHLGTPIAARLSLSQRFEAGWITARRDGQIGTGCGGRRRSRGGKRPQDRRSCRKATDCRHARARLLIRHQDDTTSWGRRIVRHQRSRAMSVGVAKVEGRPS